MNNKECIKDCKSVKDLSPEEYEQVKIVFEGIFLDGASGFKTDDLIKIIGKKIADTLLNCKIIDLESFIMSVTSKIISEIKTNI